MLKSRGVTRVVLTRVVAEVGIVLIPSHPRRRAIDPEEFLFLYMLHGCACFTCRHTLCIYTHGKVMQTGLHGSRGATLIGASLAKLSQLDVNEDARWITGQYSVEKIFSGPTSNETQGCWLQFLRPRL
jgi:hypothetical protein